MLHCSIRSPLGSERLEAVGSSQMDQARDDLPFGSGGGDGAGGAQLQDVERFGTNPGNLRMRFLPADGAARPLVVALHGCTQTAAGFAEGSGWSRLAEANDFALLLPEQRAINNRKTCFSWFEPRDTRRGEGEVESIRQMIAARRRGVHGVGCAARLRHRSFRRRLDGRRAACHLSRAFRRRRDRRRTSLWRGRQRGRGVRLHVRRAHARAAPLGRRGADRRAGAGPLADRGDLAGHRRQRRQADQRRRTRQAMDQRPRRRGAGAARGRDRRDDPAGLARRGQAPLRDGVQRAGARPRHAGGRRTRRRRRSSCRPASMRRSRSPATSSILRARRARGILARLGLAS